MRLLTLHFESYSDIQQGTRLQDEYEFHDKYWGVSGQQMTISEVRI